MEAQIGETRRHFYAGKRNPEWGLNDWRWDGDLFTATALNNGTSGYSRQFFPIRSEIPTQTGVSNSFSSGSDDRNLVEIDRGKRELEKRRRDVNHGEEEEEAEEEEEEEELTEEARSLNLKLGKQVYPITQIDVADKWEVRNGKKTKIVGPSSNRTVCQVDDCQADLNGAKDYHRRHKVCDVHSKATSALVGNVMQRFCQQCSRFHNLQEFDEGKRSCRRRLAGHNKRRRKAHPESLVTTAPANDEQNSNYLLISLLKILSNLNSNNASDNAKDQNLLSQLLRSLASVAGVVGDRNLTGLLSGSQDMSNTRTSDRNPTEDVAVCQNSSAPSSALAPGRILDNDNPEETVKISSPSCSTLVVPSKASDCAIANGYNSNGGRSKVNNFDLNDVYDDSQDCFEAVLVSDAHVPKSLEEASPGCSSWVYQDPLKSSPPNASGNSASTSTWSPSSSSGKAQSRTDRIVFKLFGKDPVDLPCGLRKQILDWLSQTPTDIESHIKPGCVILSIYLRMDKAIWDQLSYDLSSSLEKLLSSSTESFWRTGWIYTRVRQRVAFVFDGQILLDTPLPHVTSRSCLIMNAKPIAVCASDTVKFSVKGFNISRGTSRLQCAFEGKYLVNECCADIVEESEEPTDIQTLTFDCVIPNVTGRGFIEVEDHGLNSSFFPFIVTEKNVCSEIRTLESIIEAAEVSGTSCIGQEEFKRLEARNLALDFLHEMGWLLHRCQTKLRLGQADPNSYLFSFKRFKWLVLFSMEHDWCAVVQKLLNVLFENVIVDSGEFESVSDALLDIELLHSAVRRNSRSMVEILLRYRPGGVLSEKNVNKGKYLFKPDMKGPGGLTPIHIAAGLDGSEQVLDALTDDPGLVGIEAWKSAHDSTGLTPCDYACLRGHYSYIHLIQRKINKNKSSTAGQHVVEIPGDGTDTKHVKISGLWTEKGGVSAGGQCRRCELKTEYGKRRKSLAIYRPAMLSMVAIAAVCVCVALLFKTSPTVDYTDSPFCWDMLEFGSI